MNKIFILCASTFCCAACTTTQLLSVNQCNENSEFKKKFFNNIDIVEKYTAERTNLNNKVYIIASKDFLMSLEFISNYCKVSTEKVLSYNTGYPSYQDFINDKTQWTNWYNKHKCENIR